MKGKKKIIIIVIAVALGALLIGGMLSSKKKQPTYAGDLKGTMVNVAQAVKTNIQTKISATGMVKSDETENVYAEVSTQVVSIPVKEGDFVKKGDILMTYDAETRKNLERDLEKLNLQLDNARIMLSQLQNSSKQAVMQGQTAVANAEKAIMDTKDGMEQTKDSLEVAEIDLLKAQNTKELTQTLYDQGLASKSEKEDADKAALTLQNQVNSLKSKMTSLEKSLETATMQQENATYDLNVLQNKVSDETKSQNISLKQNEIASLELQKQALVDQIGKATTELKAPADGVVAELKVSEGAYVNPGMEVAKIINPEKLIVKAEISPYYAAQLEKGLPVMVKYNGSTTIEVEGTVSMVSPVAVQKASQDKSAVSTAIPIEVSLKEVSGLKEGLVVDLKIITADVKDVIAVPLLATMSDDENNNYLFVVKDDYTLEKRFVKQGAADNQYVQVDDVKENEKVVTNPTEALEDGKGVYYLPLPTEAGEKK